MNDDVKNRILDSESERAKVREEIDARAKELGIEHLNEMSGKKDEFQILSDLDEYGNKFQDQMTGADERNRSELAARSREYNRVQAAQASANAESYYRACEARAKAAYEARRISL